MVDPRSSIPTGPVVEKASRVHTSSNDPRRKGEMITVALVREEAFCGRGSQGICGMFPAFGVRSFDKASSALQRRVVAVFGRHPLSTSVRSERFVDPYGFGRRARETALHEWCPSSSKERKDHGSACERSTPCLPRGHAPRLFHGRRVCARGECTRASVDFTFPHNARGWSLAATHQSCTEPRRRRQR